MRHPLLTAAAVIGVLVLAGVGCVQAPAPSSPAAPATPAAPTTPTTPPEPTPPPAKPDSGGRNGTPGVHLNVEAVQQR